MSGKKQIVKATRTKLNSPNQFNLKIQNATIFKKHTRYPKEKKNVSTNGWNSQNDQGREHAATGKKTEEHF